MDSSSDKDEDPCDPGFTEKSLLKSAKKSSRCAVQDGLLYTV